jgi:hypothetical protein
MTFEDNEEFDLVTKFGNKLMTVFVKERVGTRKNALRIFRVSWYLPDPKTQ